MNLCTSLSLTSRAAWQLTTRALVKRLAGAPRSLDERAFTDVALTTVEAFSGGIAAVTLFSVGMEAHTGADFELQVLDAAGNRISFLVQAKALKTDNPNEGYPALGDEAPGGAGIKQYEQLITSCAADGSYAGSAPMHVFYNGQRVRSDQPWPGDACNAQPPVDEEARGITIAHTAAVMDVVTTPPTSYRVGRVAPVCWPWWCFFCCGIINLADLESRTASLPGQAVSSRPLPPAIVPPAQQPAYARIAAERRGTRTPEVVPTPSDVAPPARTVVTFTLD